MENIKNPLFIFEQIGIWDKTCTMEFTTPLYGGSPSMIAEHKGKRFSHECIDIKEVLERNQHSHIDILKMDIEGAAFNIIERIIDIGIYPKQIVAEFERMKRKTPNDFFQFYSRLMMLISQLETLGYRTYVIPRNDYKYFSIELNFVRKTS